MKVKNEYQRFFRDERFTHHITLPPSPLTEKSVMTMFREIEFKLNKTFLKSAFPKYDKTDTFRFFIFPEDREIKSLHFHILLFSPLKRDKESNKEHCIACRFRDKPFFETCKYCTARELYRLIEQQVPKTAYEIYSERTRKNTEEEFTKKFIETMKDVVVTINDEVDNYSNIYATKKQRFDYESADGYLVCT